MLMIPAIDLKEGRCVRLEQGRMDRETVFSKEPEAVARRWVEAGAERIHVVDLDGAVRGGPKNRHAIERILAAVEVPLEVGGGIRDMETLESYLAMGVRYVVLGTAALRNPGFVAEVCEAYPQRILLAIDAREGRVSVEGWTEDSELGPVELARRYEGCGLGAVIYTDIHRDGMKTGPNVEATRRLAQAVSIPVIASGGISDLSDVRSIMTLAPYGVMGMISGRALYEGTLDLAEAIRLLKHEGA